MLSSLQQIQSQLSERVERFGDVYRHPRRHTRGLPSPVRSLANQVRCHAAYPIQVNVSRGRITCAALRSALRWQRTRVVLTNILIR